MSRRLRALGRLAVFVAIAFVLFPSKKYWLPKLFPGLHGVAGCVAAACWPRSASRQAR